jgi:hypothetical protein
MIDWRSNLEGPPCNKWTVVQAPHAAQDKQQQLFSRWVWERFLGHFGETATAGYTKDHTSYYPALAVVDKTIQEQLR